MTKRAKTPPRTGLTSTTTSSTTDDEPVERRCRLWICLDCGWRDWAARGIGARGYGCIRCGSALLNSSSEDLGCGPPGSRGSSLFF
jgi:hypothetical protein